MDITALNAWLGRFGVGPGYLHVLPDGPVEAVHGAEGCYLVRDGAGWLVCYSERGQVSDSVRHGGEREACLDVLDRLGPDYGTLLRPPGTPAPRPLLTPGSEPADLQAVLTARSGADPRAAVRDWLTAAAASLYGGVFAADPGPAPVLDGDRFDRRVRLRMSALAARRTLVFEHFGGDWAAAFDTGWRDEFTAVSLSASAFTRDGELAVHEVQAHREPDGWLRCTAVRYGGAEAREEHRWAAFLADQMAARDGAYGHVDRNEQHPRTTAHERTLGAAGYRAYEQSETRLRGYGWATACGPGAAKALGGKAAVEASGAFAEVRTLRHGGLLMVAADRIDTWSPERVRAALGPALAS
ncbi:hypothetical protein [Glycomyces sp. NRRL B-16210]|uniref:hypothetical protein n=1 Tax=Glycomyces sp. NRRL B-16210 TaxID=1463821 RepID=UPI0004C0FA06|nr:hypothetical protein [Glycomyces sp. NRRL B-16210]